MIDAVTIDFQINGNEKSEYFKMIDDILPTLSKNCVVDGQFLPNFIASRRTNHVDLLKKTIDLGFHYDVNDVRFIKEMTQQIILKSPYTGQPANNVWIESIFKKRCYP